MYITTIIAGLLVALQASPPTAVTCTVTNDPAGRVYRIWKADAASPAGGAARGTGGATWRIGMRTRDKPEWLALDLPGASPVLTSTTASLSYTNANGGRQVRLDVRPGQARLDVWVDHGLEVNVDPNLDPRIDELSTGGPLTALECAIGR